MFRSPSHSGLPGLATMLDDLPASTAQVARHLDLSTVTLNKYIKTGQAPRSVMLSLFWETRWGRSAADTEAANWGAMYYRQAKSYERELQRMAGALLRLEQDLSSQPGAAANGSVWRVC